MADETAKPDRAVERASARGTQSRPSAEPDEVRFSIDELRENPRLLGSGVTVPMIAGAMHGATRKTFTLDEAAKLVDEFLTREHT